MVNFGIYKKKLKSTSQVQLMGAIADKQVQLMGVIADKKIPSILWRIGVQTRASFSRRLSNQKYQVEAKLNPNYLKSC